MLSLRQLGPGLGPGLGLGLEREAAGAKAAPGGQGSPGSALAGTVADL